MVKDIFGRDVFRKVLNDSETEIKIGKNLKPGIYFIVLEGDGIVVKRIVKS
jgi:hypothetical protein